MPNYKNKQVSCCRQKALHCQLNNINALSVSLW